MAKKGFTGGIAGMLGEPRSGYNEGGRGYQDYWTMVQESFSNAGGQDATGMNIQDFAEMYFPRKAEGGRIGLAEGDTPSEAYLKDIFFSIPGGDQLGSISFQEWKNSPSGQHYKDKWIAEHRPKFDNGGTVDLESLIKLYMDEMKLTREEAERKARTDWGSDAAAKMQFKNFDWNKAEGGRIGFQRAGLAALPRTRKVKPGYDQEFTLQRGVSAAPIKQSTVLEEILGGGILGIGASKLLKDKKRGIGDNNPPSPIEEEKTPKKEPPKDPDFIPEVLELFNRDEDEGMKYNEKLGRKIMDMEHYTNKMPENYEGPTVETVTSGYDAHPFTQKDFDGGTLDNKTIKKAFLSVAGDEGETEVEIQPFDRDKFLLTPERGQKEIALRLIKQKLIEDKADPKIITHITNIQKILNDEIKKLGYLGAGAELEENLSVGFGLFDQLKRKKNATGGRIGFKDGEGVMSRVGDMVDVRNVPYYGGKALQGLVNSAETLSKFPFAAGELGSKLIQQKPNKEMFMEAIENIAPGSWSENLGLTSLVEGMGEKRPDDAKTVGGILGLGTEIAVPTGGAFKAGQFLLSKASKAMGKVKDGKTLEKLVDEKLTDSGQSRRDFNIMAATGSLMVALKTIGLGGLLKVGAKKDIGIKFKKQFVNDDVDYGTSGLMNFDFIGHTKAGKEFLKKFYKDNKMLEKTIKHGNVDPIDAKKILEAAKKNKLSTSVDDLIEDGVSKVKEGAPDPTYYASPNWSHKILGPGKEMFKKFKKRFNKQTTKENIDDFVQEGNWHYENDQWRNLDKVPGNTKIWTDPRPRSEIKDIIDIIEPIVKKAEGGRIGYDEGGWTQKDFDKYLEDRKKRDKENRKEDFLDDFEKWKKWKETEGGTLDWAAEGGRIGLQTGGPPITLQRPMFNDGGLTKTIPPERGPDPQGLPSALYNGIMRPRSY